MLSEGTIIALATPEGSGAIGVIRLSGPDAFEITKIFFRPKSKKPLDKIPVKTSTLGNFTVDEEIIDEVLSVDDSIALSARADMVAVFDRDPACHQMLQPILFFKGYQALQAYRVSHWLWKNDRKEIAYFIQMRCSEVFGVDIHPGAVLGCGIMIDHAHSIVIGETSRVGDNVSMLHSVTLGGTGKADGDRHPTIENGVLIGAGAKILGNISVGYCSCSALSFSTISAPRSRMLTRSSGVMWSRTATAVSSARGLVVMVFP